MNGEKNGFTLHYFARKFFPSQTFSETADNVCCAAGHLDAPDARRGKVN